MEPKVLTPVPKHRGRPRPAERHVPAMTWLPQSSYDRIAQIAIKHDVSMSSVLRDIVAFRFAIPKNK